MVAAMLGRTTGIWAGYRLGDASNATVRRVGSVPLIPRERRYYGHIGTHPSARVLRCLDLQSGLFGQRTGGPHVCDY